MIDLKERDVSGILERGGTFLKSSRYPEFMDMSVVREASDKCREFGIDALVVCGGDGTFRGARDLSGLKDENGEDIGIPCICVPCTIDNDLGCTDYCIGFDTAVNTVTENIDRLRDTTASHDRCSVVQVMGRHCGDIALHAAINCGAVSVLVPEEKIDIESNIYAKMTKTLSKGKSHFIVIIAEGVTGDGKKKKVTNSIYMEAPELAEKIEEHIRREKGKGSLFEARSTVLGHIQRGGSPSARDRIVAAEMGYYAVTLLTQGKKNCVVVRRNSKLGCIDIPEALEMKKNLNMDLWDVANAISI
jgi:6-phosphofructokinase 1